MLYLLSKAESAGGFNNANI